ncbi:hypothetical protein MLD38_012421 [Melastoma candidum]|uniref:Uncharacterized protein n=1 Tax=Melastoma candidum TaxID=119954 RepID=A0ACB9R6B3_9MYRT|nr:hypothetical protein MLD38_012421 [Melastoma candidum]
MCGRTRCTLSADDIPRACHRPPAAPVRTIDIDRYQPAYNVAPGWNLPVLRRGDNTDGDDYVIHSMKWGLVPSFTKKNEKPDHYRMFNARSESVNEKASFRRLIPKNRCLLAVEGFYEWKKDGLKKQPYYIHFRDGRPLVLAALYDSWKNSEGELLYTFTILTTSSSSSLQWLHDRMPVILGNKESTDAWLTGSSAAIMGMLKPYEQPDLIWYPVTSAIGKPSFDGPECVKEIQVKTENKNTISNFFSMKAVKKEQEIEAKAGQESCVEVIKRSPKEEPVEDSIRTSVDDKVNSAPTKSGVKREHESLTSDAGEWTSEADIKHASTPEKKKQELKPAPAKRATLHSYFSKA